MIARVRPPRNGPMLHQCMACRNPSPSNFWATAVDCSANAKIIKVAIAKACFGRLIVSFIDQAAIGPRPDGYGDTGG